MDDSKMVRILQNTALKKKSNPKTVFSGKPQMGVFCGARVNYCASLTMIQATGRSSLATG
jgi:hypothetical protein